TTSDSNAGTPNAPTGVLAPSYNATGQRTGLTVLRNGSLDFTNGYTPDALDRIRLQVQSGPLAYYNRVARDYTPDSKFLAVRRYSGPSDAQLIATTSYTQYDDLARLTALQHTKPGSTINQFSYTIDVGDRLQQQTTLADGTANFAYDVLDQLTG